MTSQPVDNAKQSRRVRFRHGIALALVLAVSSMVTVEAGANGQVDCTLLVGGKPSVTKSFALDANGTGREHLYLEANQFQADAMIEAIEGQVEVGMEIVMEAAHPAAQWYNYALLRGTVSEPARQQVGVVNGVLECELR